VRSLALSSKRKAGIYRDLERSVGDVWRRYLKRNQMRYFHEHDGFTCEREVDLNQLSNEIRDITGYEVKFDMNKITSDFTGS
jgi:hypothetical protein